MSDLVSWLESTLTRLETVAREVSGHSENQDDPYNVELWVQDGDPFPDTLATTRRSVLARVEAERHILELHSGSHECSGYDRGCDGDFNSCMWVLVEDTCTTVELIAWGHRYEPGYDAAWAPEGATTDA